MMKKEEELEERKDERRSGKNGGISPVLQHPSAISEGVA